MHSRELSGGRGEPWARLCERLYDHVGSVQRGEHVKQEALKRAHCSPAIECNPEARGR